MNNDDYNFNNNLITIYKAYLDKEFNKEREILILMLMYQKDDNYASTLITIKR